MADKRIDQFATLSTLDDDDLILVSSDDETYNTKISVLKEAAKEGATSEITEAKEAATAAQTAADEAAANAEAAQTAADTALEKATAAETATADAQTAASTAQSAATAAQTAAENAEGTASGALTMAEAAQTAAEEAQETANAAKTTAEAAQTTANAAKTAASTAQTKATANEALIAELQETVNNSGAGETTVKSVSTDTDGNVVVTYTDGSTSTLEISASGDGGLSFDSGYVDDSGYLHLTKDGTDIEGFTAFYVGKGGSSSSGGSSMVFAITSGTSATVTNTSEYVAVKLKFVSTIIDTDLDTGSGTLQVYINGNLIKTTTVLQGENTYDELIPVSSLNSDSNKVKLVATDSYGLSATRTMTVTKVGLSIAWDISGNTVKNSSGIYTVNITPTGAAGTTKTITVHVTGPDSYDETYTKTTTISGVSSVGISISGLVKGEYIITADCSMTYNGETINSNTLTAAIAQISSSDDTVIASPFSDETGTQYTTLVIPYRVIDGTNESADVTLSAYDSDENLKFSQTVEVDFFEQTWNYRPTTTGTVKLVITCGDTEWTHSIDISALSIGVSEITESLDYKLDPASLSNLDDFTLSDNFDKINGGLTVDDDGIQCIKVIKGDRLTIPYKLFGASVDTAGREFKMIYTVENCTDFDATAIECLSGGIGISVKANRVDISSSLTSIDLLTCEDEKTELDVNITNKNNNRLITIWESGVPHKVAQYGATSDKFNQDTPVGITVGSDDCTVTLYLIRAYTKSLGNSEMLSNFIVDGKDGTEIAERFERNAIYSNGADEDGNAIADVSGTLNTEFVAANNINAHIFTISAPGFPVGKEKANYITGTCDYEQRVGGSARKFLQPVAMRYRLQGTSSLDYQDSAANVDIDFTEDIVWEDGSTHDFQITDNSIPISYINIKVNDASSENINNILLAEWFNRYQPYMRPAREADARVRDTVEGDMCIFYYHNSGTADVKAGSATVSPGETVLYAIGNCNNSKKNSAVFGQDDDDDILCVEVNNNTDDFCRFKKGGVTSSDFGDDAPFGVRYISDTLTEDGTTEESAAAALWTIPVDFINSCNPDNATGGELDETVTYKIDKAGTTKSYAADTAEYRTMKFRNEAENYFIVDTLMYHYLFTLFFCMVDNRAKNTFYGYSKSTGKWHLCFGYDFDTSMGINNVGKLNMSYGYLDDDHIDHNENSGYVFNAYDSTMFTLLKEAFPEELEDMYLTLETQGCFNVDNFLDLCTTYQDKICEALWVEDFQRKYINPLLNLSDNTFLEKGQGKKRLQRKQFLHFQQPFISSYFKSNFCKDNQATFRSYGTAEKMTVTPYSDMFVVFVGGNTVKSVRAYAGETVEIDISDFNANDTETHIRNAPFIKDLGDLSDMKMSTCVFSNFTKLKSIILGSTASGYENRQLTDLDVSNCEALETLNIANCTQYSAPLDLTKNIMLKYLNTKGTSITGVTFAVGGKIQTAILNSLLSFTAKNLQYLTTLEFDTSSLTSVIVENSSGVDVATLLNAALYVSNVRAVGVDMSLKNATLLKRLLSVKGWDAEGNETDSAVISGSCYMTGVGATVLKEIRAAYPDLTITYGSLLDEYTVRFITYPENDSTQEPNVYDTQTVEDGGAAVTPSGTPTLEPSVAKTFTFSGWGASYDNITMDTDIPAVFSESTRIYTVKYMNGLETVQTNQVAYNESCTYEGGDLYKSGYLYAGWDAEATNVASDMTINAVFILPTLPSSPVDIADGEYITSDVDGDVSAYTPSEVYAICAAGMADQYFEVGDQIKITPNADATIADEAIVLDLVDFEHCKLEDGSAFAPTTFLMTGILNAKRQMNTSATNAGGWADSAMRAWLNSTMFNNLPAIWRSVIKAVQRIGSIGEQSTSVQTTIDKLFLPTSVEILGNTDEPYVSEVDSDAPNKRFPGYTTSDSHIKKTLNGGGTAQTYWLCSPSALNSYTYDYIYSNGRSCYNMSGSGSSATSSCGVAFGFCI